MRALVITKHGAPDVLRVEERPDPGPPGPGQVRVAVRAAGINFADLMARVGIYPDAPKPPCVVGYEVCGDVEAVGDGVTGVAVGERVMGGTRFNGYAEHALVDLAALGKVPEAWSYEEGAAFPVNFITAYIALVRYGACGRGERVLVHSAAGGVGIAAMQMARVCGAAEVYGTASTAKLDAVRRLGADHAIDYRESDFVAEVRRISGERKPIDVAMDAVGGTNLRRTFDLVRAGGRLISYGTSELMPGERRSIRRVARTLARAPRFNPLKLTQASKGVIGVNVLRLWDVRGGLLEWIEPMQRWMHEGKLQPVVAEAFPLERGADAHRYLHERRNVGKVVLTL